MNTLLGVAGEESQFAKRFKGFLWIVLAGVITKGLELVVQDIGLLQLSPEVQAITVIILTGVISQITKYLNRKTNQ